MVVTFTSPVSAFLTRTSTPASGPLARFLAGKRMSFEATRILDDLAVTLPSLRAQVSTLSGGQRQAIAVGRAVLWGSRIVVLDEPTAALGVQQTAMVYRLIRTLKDRGMSVILISHNMVDVFEVADRVTALYLGRVAADVPAAEVNHSRVVELITAGRSGDLGIARPETATI